MLCSFVVKFFEQNCICYLIIKGIHRCQNWIANLNLVKQTYSNCIVIWIQNFWIGDTSLIKKKRLVHLIFILHLHEIVEGLYFHCSLSVCVCVCVCLCVYCFLWTKFQPNGCTDLDAVFAKWLLTALARTLYEISDFRSNV